MSLKRSLIQLHEVLARQFGIDPRKIVAIRPRHSKKLVRVLYCLTYWLLFRWRYGGLRVTSYVSPRAQILHKRYTILGPHCIIYSGASISGPHFECGERVSIGWGAHLFGPIYMGDDVMVAPNVIIAGGNHGIARGPVPMNAQSGFNKGPIRIGSDVWIGGNAVILTGVELGDGCVVGGGSVVTKSVPPYAIAVGNPAKVIRFRE